VRVEVQRPRLSSQSKSHPIRVAVIEDDLSMMTWLCGLIESAADLELANCATAFRDGEALIISGGYDVLLCDLGLPDGDGIDLIRQSAATHPQSDIMVVTLFAEQRKVVKCIRAGARGYLLKGMEEEDCVEAIREIRRGGSPISPAIARLLLLHIQPEIAMHAATLSSRELEILNMMAKGFSKGECANLLALSINTVSTHVKNIYRKLEVNSSAEAVFEANNQGMFD
jgi:DNA-binding NarL/FixJ family response regulator